MQGRSKLWFSAYFLFYEFVLFKMCAADFNAMVSNFVTVKAAKLRRLTIQGLTNLNVVINASVKSHDVTNW